jgi:REP element-mobilizing transposase RayT
MSQPLAYFITFVAYGSWLHGDDRGSVDIRANGLDSPRELPNAGWREWERTRLVTQEVHFDARWRFEIDASFRERCEHAGWGMLALNVRTNHVHIVVTAEQTPERLMTSLKAWATRRLLSRGLARQGSSVWAWHGSTRYLWKEAHVEAAIDYVLNQQGAALGMDPG